MSQLATSPSVLTRRSLASVTTTRQPNPGPRVSPAVRAKLRKAVATLYAAREALEPLVVECQIHSYLPEV